MSGAVVVDQFGLMFLGVFARRESKSREDGGPGQSTQIVLRLPTSDGEIERSYLCDAADRDTGEFTDFWQACGQIASGTPVLVRLQTNVSRSGKTWQKATRIVPVQWLDDVAPLERPSNGKRAAGLQTLQS